MRRQRLFWQIFPVCLLVSLCTILAVGGFATSTFKSFYFEHMTQDIKARALLVERKILDLAADSPAALQEFCRQTGRRVATRITVVAADGTVLADSNEDPQRMEKHGQRPEIIRAFNGQTGFSLHFSKTLRQDMLYVAIPLQLSVEGEPGALRLSLPATALYTVLNTIRNKIILASLLVILLATLLSHQLARRISRPLEEIKQGAEQLARGEVDQFIHIHDQGMSVEMSGLIRSLNQMAAQITDRIRLTQRQHNELEAVFFSMTEAVLAIDGKERVIRLNRAAGDLFQIEPKSGKDSPVQGVLRNPELMEMIRSTLNSNNGAASEIELFDGRRHTTLRVRVVPLRDNERQPIGALMVMNDVTRINRLETLRRDFVANVSHELKTPITVIKGYVETLLDDGLDDHKNRATFLQIVFRQTDRLDAIVNDLLTLSRIENTIESKTENEVEESIDLALREIQPVLAAARQTCEFKAAEKQLRIELCCPAELKTAHNPALLEEAVVNLLSNAITYSSAGSAVVVRGESLLDNKNNKLVRISVEDQGIGIRGEHLDRIFERFYRCDKARSRESGGTGLGLAIVKHIAQSHGGTVEVESQFGRGTVFRLDLPG